MNQHCYDVSCRRQVADRFQTGSKQAGSAIAFVLKDPLFGHGESFRLRELDQCRCLARDCVILLLAIR